MDSRSIDFWIDLGLDVPVDAIFQKAEAAMPNPAPTPKVVTPRPPGIPKPPKSAGLVTKPESNLPHYSDTPNLGKFKKLLRHPELGPKLQGKIGYHPKTDQIRVLHPSAHATIQEHLGSKPKE